MVAGSICCGHAAILDNPIRSQGAGGVMVGLDLQRRVSDLKAFAEFARGVAEEGIARGPSGISR